ncbi:MAG: 16S rRNA (cytosine(1402)-N(4))-methyltransferase RsmH [Gemmatimonadales bacterium]
MMAVYHTPVLSTHIAALAQHRSRLVDCTVGGGGHAATLVRYGGELLAIDRDPEAIEQARKTVASSRVRWLNCNFADDRALGAIREFRPDFVLFDLGVSGHQLDCDGRGFSFRPGVQLDMRMGEEDTNAAEMLNDLPHSSLTAVFREGADERRSRELATAIVRRRQNSPFRTSDDLVNAIRSVLGPRSGPSDFARIFQALRMAVNSEQAALQVALPAVLQALVPQGIMAVISYHSGEDRIVKSFFREWARSCVCAPAVPVCSCRGRALGHMDPRKGIQPTDDEVARNPRARSARLRVFVKANAC